MGWHRFHCSWIGNRPSEPKKNQTIKQASGLTSKWRQLSATAVATTQELLCQPGIPRGKAQEWREGKLASIYYSEFSHKRTGKPAQNSSSLGRHLVVGVAREWHRWLAYTVCARFAQSSPGSTGAHLRSTRTRLDVIFIGSNWKSRVVVWFTYLPLLYLTLILPALQLIIALQNSTCVENAWLLLNSSNELHMGVLTVQPHDRTTHITYRVDEFPPRLLLASFMGSPYSVVGFRGGLKCSVCLTISTDSKILPCQHAFCRPCLSQLVQSLRTNLQLTTCPQCGTKNHATVGRL